MIVNARPPHLPSSTQLSIRDEVKELEEDVQHLREKLIGSSQVSNLVQATDKMSDELQKRCDGVKKKTLEDIEMGYMRRRIRST